MPDGISISASQAVGIGKQTPRVYVPRIVHVNSDTVHKLLGVASHEAWKQLARKYKMIRLKGHASEHHQLTGAMMKAWTWELVASQIG